jgi:hypothetical protein
MDATLRQALLFVRFTAVCVMLVGVLDTGLYVAQCWHPKQPPSPAPIQDPAPASTPEQAAPVKVVPLVLNAIPFVVGIVMLVKARSIAEWIGEKLE